ncbi:MAG: hypothetical protein FXF54_08105, partial [Kosmotoga sp.]
MNEIISEVLSILRESSEKKNIDWKKEVLFLHNYLQDNGDKIGNFSQKNDIITDINRYRKKYASEKDDLSLSHIEYDFDKIDTKVLEKIKDFNLLDLIYTDEEGEYDYQKEYINIDSTINYWVEKAKKAKVKDINFIEADKFFAYNDEFVKKNEDFNFNLYFSEPFYYEIFKTNYSGYENVNVKMATKTNEFDYSIYDNLIDIDKKGLVCSFPDSGRKFLLDSDVKLRSKRKEISALNNLLMSMSDGSILSIILPVGFLVSPESQKIRSLIIPDEKSENNFYNVKVEKISHLPQFKEYSSINLVLLELKKKKDEIKENYSIEIGEFKLKDGKLEETIHDKISSTDLKGGKSWSIEQNLKKEKFWQLYEKSEKIDLGDHATVIRGKSINKSYLSEDGGYLVINLSNMKKGKLKFADEKISVAEEKKPKSFLKYEVKPNDVVVACRGTVFKSAYIPDINSDIADIYLSKEDVQLLKEYKLV